MAETAVHHVNEQLQATPEHDSDRQSHPGTPVAESQPVQASESSDDESDAEEAQPAAVLTRERRSNAGNRYSRLLAAEERADEEAHDGEFYTAEGWQEQVDDEAFSGSEAEAPDDISLHSSSDDDSDDDGAAEDQGEKELRKQERAARHGKTKKRKTMQDMYKPRPVKQARITATAAASASSSAAPGSADAAAPTKPRKKSERVSWIP
ncbi:MAG: hypothetical protein INR71_02120, partial [Terriglobus roseus]|nr:hypothetical protein [Terriglobus roseus]